MSRSCSKRGRVEDFVRSSKFEFENLNERGRLRRQSIDELLMLMRFKIRFGDASYINRSQNCTQ
jgi:hypothetical protein